MTNKQILKHIRALAHEECANYHAGNCALTDERCHIINTNYQSVQDGAIDCDYFLEVVLPADWKPFFIIIPAKEEIVLKHRLLSCRKKESL